MESCWDSATNDSDLRQRIDQTQAVEERYGAAANRQEACLFTTNQYFDVFFISKNQPELNDVDS